MARVRLGLVCANQGGAGTHAGMLGVRVFIMDPLSNTSALVRSCAEISVRNTAAVTTAPASVSRAGTGDSAAWTGAAGTAGATGRVSGPWATTGSPSGGK